MSGRVRAGALGAGAAKDSACALIRSDRGHSIFVDDRLLLHQAVEGIYRSAADGCEVAL